MLTNILFHVRERFARRHIGRRLRESSAQWNIRTTLNIVRS